MHRGERERCKVTTSNEAASSSTGIFWVCSFYRSILMVLMSHKLWFVFPCCGNFLWEFKLTWLCMNFLTVNKICFFYARKAWLILLNMMYINCSQCDPSQFKSLNTHFCKDLSLNIKSFKAKSLYLYCSFWLELLELFFLVLTFLFTETLLKSPQH